MPVIGKSTRDQLEGQLTVRFDSLLRVLAGRELTSSSEGARRGHWIAPDCMTATVGSALDIRLAVSDFEAILHEVKKLK